MWHKVVLPLIVFLVLGVSNFSFAENEAPDFALGLSLTRTGFALLDGDIAVLVGFEAGLADSISLFFPVGFTSTSSFFGFEAGAGARFYFGKKAVKGFWLGATVGADLDIDTFDMILHATPEIGYKQVFGKKTSSGVYLEARVGFAFFLVDTYDSGTIGLPRYSLDMGYAF